MVKLTVTGPKKVSSDIAMVFARHGDDWFVWPIESPIAIIKARDLGDDFTNTIDGQLPVGPFDLESIMSYRRRGKRAVSASQYNWVHIHSGHPSP